MGETIGKMVILILFWSSLDIFSKLSIKLSHGLNNVFKILSSFLSTKS